jgi:TolB-like protein/DNA-binding winged helix-turn-helix (wHTH) protein/Flp pilus assembly protein TadD
MDQPLPRCYRFGHFELDPRSGQLERDGVGVRLQEQPLQALLLLLERAGDVVTRDELRRRVWQDETFVDFDHGVNSIVKRLRDALGDSAENPVFIETLPRRGYRFLVHVEAVAPVSAPKAPVEATPPEAMAGTPRRGWALRLANARSGQGIAAAALVVSLAAAAYLAFRLMSPRTAAPAARQVRLAVLFFENLTGHQDQQFFADGLHEEMISRLGRMQPGRLAVIARTSVMPYRDATKSIATIARELDVDFVLEGSVRQAGERFRITAQLIRADDQSHLWTATYDRSWSDIFAIQSDVGARVADSLALELLPASEAAAAHGHVSPKAYEHYLKGRFYWNQRTRDPSTQLNRAIEQFKLAIAEEPGYALAYAGLADAYNSVFFANPGQGDAPYASASTAIERALQLDPQLASAYGTRAWMTMHFDHDWAEAERTFQRAFEIDPGDPLTRFRHAHLLAIRGRVPEAEKDAESARRLDPLSAPITNILAWFAYYRGDRGRAVQRMAEAAELEGNPTQSRVFTAYIDSLNGDCDRARTELSELALDVETFRLGEAAFAHARCGGPASPGELRQLLLAQRLTYSTAMFHFGRGEMDAFYEWLNRAIDERFPEPMYLATDPAFNRERQNPRFQAALHRLGL